MEDTKRIASLGDLRDETFGQRVRAQPSDDFRSGFSLAITLNGGVIVSSIHGGERLAFGNMADAVVWVNNRYGETLAEGSGL
ncbi:MAG: hypothetical protein AAGJ50_03760 [Pseudomonadota bacterium]